MKQKLQTVKNYADANKISTTWVYTLISTGKLKCEIIDGVKFVVVKK